MKLTYDTFIGRPVQFSDGEKGVIVLKLATPSAHQFRVKMRDGSLAFRNATAGDFKFISPAEYIDHEAEDQ